LHCCGTHCASEKRVFAERLESTAAERRALHIARRSKNDRGPFGDGLRCL
jgi:hypothetical protein